MTNRKRTYAKPRLIEASIVGAIQSSSGNPLGDSQAALGVPVVNTTLS